MYATGAKNSMTSDSFIVHRSFLKDPKKVDKAQGQYLYFGDKKVLDASGGAAVTSVGHSNPEIIKPMQDQLESMTYINSSEFTSDATETFGNALLEDYSDVFSSAYIVNSGSEAINAAYKLCIQYHQDKGISTKMEVISRNQSYHGNGLAGLALSGFPARRAYFEKVLSTHVHKVSPAYEYRYKNDGETTEKFVHRLAQELDDKIVELGPENVAAFFAETVVGATTGCVPAPAGYFQAIKAVCEKHDVLLVLDEIMCGSGRTGKFFAWEHEHVVPDIVVCGKSLSSGYSPLSACIFSHKVADGIKKGSGAFSNGHTYQAYPLACRAGTAVLNYIHKNNLLNNVTAMGEYLGSKLKDLEDIETVGNIRGRGLFWGVEFVRNKETKEPFPPEKKIGQRIKDQAFEKGISIYPGAGTSDGYCGDHVIIAPMYICEAKDIDYIVETLRKSILEVMAEETRV